MLKFIADPPNPQALSEIVWALKALGCHPGNMPLISARRHWAEFQTVLLPTAWRYTVSADKCATVVGPL